MKKVYEVKRCSRCGCYTCENEFDHDLNCFDIYDDLDKYIATVYPNSIEDMKECQRALKEGQCPVCDNWEDGHGHTIMHALS